MDPRTQVKDYYKVLGVAPEADKAAIRAAYRKLAREFHPDRNKSPAAEEKFKEIGEAYDVLKDEKKRAAYDQLRKGGPIPGFGGAGGFEGFDFRDGGDLSDLLDQLFGGFARGRSAGTRRAARGSAPRGRDLEATLEVSLEDAYRGGTRRVTVGEKSLDVKIPAGVTDGQKIRLKGQGGAAIPGGTPGDLILNIRIRPHPRFRLDGRDLHLRLNITPWEAALGGAISLETLSGSIELKVPAGARSGQKLRVRGRGLPGSPAGDLFVELLIQAPPADSAAVRELYEALAERTGFDPRAR